MVSQGEIAAGEAQGWGAATRARRAGDGQGPPVRPRGGGGDEGRAGRHGQGPPVRPRGGGGDEGRRAGDGQGSPARAAGSVTSVSGRRDRAYHLRRRL